MSAVSTLIVAGVGRNWGGDEVCDSPTLSNADYRPDPARHDRPLSGRPSVPWSVSSAAGGALLMAGAASIYKASLRIPS